MKSDKNQSGLDFRTYFNYKEFKENYSQDKEYYNEKYPDSTEIHFIEEGIKHYEICLQNVTYITSTSGEEIIESEYIGTNLHQVILFKIKDGNNVVIEEERKRLKYAFERILNYFISEKNNHEMFFGSEKYEKTNVIEDNTRDHESESFKLFDKIRYEEIGDFDMTILLQETSKNYNIELLKALLYDLSFYLFEEKETQENGYTSEQIDLAIKERINNGLEVPLNTTTKPKNLTQKGEKLFQNMQSSIDLEGLLFPYEFFSLYRFEQKIKNKINELENKGINKTNIKLQWHGKNVEFTELIKALHVNGTFKGTYENAILSASEFFGVKINPETIPQQLQEIKKRNNGNETKFLTNLTETLYNELQNKTK
ncbi:RteC domain-containing protein [Formosa sp. A9]|uniref:RteC domain-containing protein n=1 Tax=Formosa sp. A9 TaxID=3442641 RepID=UPI003EBF4B90